MYALMLMAVLGVQPAEAPADLGWMSGYWLSCENGGEVSETWSQRRGTAMLGTNLTVEANGNSSFEQMRIDTASGGQPGISFFAQPRGAAQPTEFRMVRSAASEAVFENPAHDFPHRVIYRREGEVLIGRIEGRSGGREQSMEWRFRAAPFNSRCPAAR